MIALIIHIVFWGAFFHVIRSSKARGCNMMVVGAVNYLLASLVCFGISMVEGNLSLSRVTLLWGCAQGVAYVTGFYLMHT